jgi:hypothetical protein
VTTEPSIIYCENHPHVETTLRCNRCEKPICAKCAVRTPTGYRCTECVKTHQKAFDTAEWFDYLVASAIAAILAYIGSLIASRIGFFTIFIAPIAGMVIAEAVRRALRRRRSKRLFQLTAAAAAFGSLLPLLMGLAGGLFFSFFIIWQLLYAVLVTSTVYYRLAGIRL